MILDGKALAKELRSTLKGKATLAILIGADDAASAQYRREKLKACKEAGIEVRLLGLDALKKPIAADAVTVELPLPDGVSETAVLADIPPAQDAEGVSPLNFGKLMAARAWSETERLPLPCTAAAIAHLVRQTGTVEGKEAVVIGRSNIVGKPAAHLLSLLGATVTLCHSKTRELDAHIRRADIVVAASGRPGLIRGEWIKQGAVVIDAAGDVDFEGAVARAGWITPVPGGVGPVTTAMMLSNVLRLARR